MRIIAFSRLQAFGTRHPEAMGALRAWYDKARRARWTCMNDIIADIPSADPVGSEHVVFNILRNDYRLVVAVYFPAQTMWVKFIGTHAQYDRINVEEL